MHRISSMNPYGEVSLSDGFIAEGTAKSLKGVSPFTRTLKDVPQKDCFVRWPGSLDAMFHCSTEEKMSVCFAAFWFDQNVFEDCTCAYDCELISKPMRGHLALDENGWLYTRLVNSNVLLQALRFGYSTSISTDTMKIIIFSWFLYGLFHFKVIILFIKIYPVIDLKLWTSTGMNSVSFFIVSFVSVMFCFMFSLALSTIEEWLALW